MSGPAVQVGARRTPAASRACRIGEAARSIGVSASSLRLWERQGLVRPHRSRTGYRLYTEEDLAQLRRVSRMRRQQVNAPGIRRLLTAANRGAGSPHAGDDASVAPAVRRAPRGQRLRELRQRRGYSLREAARRSQLSVSFLSALERDATGASVATLQRLTQAYGVTLLDLFDPVAGSERRLRDGERPVLELDGAGVRIEQLAVGAQLLEPQLFTLAPRATSAGAYAHAGEEFLFVLDGALTIWIGERERYRLQAGDSLAFPSTLPHRWRNRAGGETRLLWINTPPTF